MSCGVPCLLRAILSSITFFSLSEISALASGQRIEPGDTPLTRMLGELLG